MDSDLPRRVAAGDGFFEEGRREYKTSQHLPGRRTAPSTRAVRIAAAVEPALKTAVSSFRSATLKSDSDRSTMWSILIGLAALCRPRVVFTDCDGTLLRPDHTLSDRARQTLRELDRAGVIVVPATGRGRAGTWTSSVLTELRGGAPGVFCNGCTSFDRDGTALPPALLPTSLPASVLGALGTSAVGAGCVAVAYVGDEALYEYSASALIPRLALVGDSPLRRVECLRSACAASPVSKILLLHDAHALPALRAAVAPVVGGASGGAVTQAIDWMLEVVPSHADKGSAAGELLARWGLGCADVPVRNRERLLPTTKRLPPPGA